MVIVVVMQLFVRGDNYLRDSQLLWKCQPVFRCKTAKFRDRILAGEIGRISHVRLLPFQTSRLDPLLKRKWSFVLSSAAPAI